MYNSAMGRTRQDLKKVQKKLLDDHKTQIYRLTLVASVVQPLTTLPQVYKIYTTHDVSGLSLYTWVGYALVGLAFLAYGLAYKLRPIAIAQVLWFSLQMSVVVGILMYR